MSTFEKYSDDDPVVETVNGHEIRFNVHESRFWTRLDRRGQYARKEIGDVRREIGKNSDPVTAISVSNWVDRVNVGLVEIVDHVASQSGRFGRSRTGQFRLVGGGLVDPYRLYVLDREKLDALRELEAERAVKERAFDVEARRIYAEQQAIVDALEPMDEGTFKRLRSEAKEPVKEVAAS